MKCIALRGSSEACTHASRVARSGGVIGRRRFTIATVNDAMKALQRGFA